MEVPTGPSPLGTEAERPGRINTGFVLSPDWDPLGWSWN